MVTLMYRNDTDHSIEVPGWGFIHAGERVSHTAEFLAPLNLLNFPGLVDVLAEEADGKTRDYEETPEVVTDTVEADAKAKEGQNG